MTAPTLDLADIQGGVLRGYGYPTATYLLVRVEDAEAARAWLGALAGEVRSAEPWTGAKPDCALNVALTATGLEALGVALDGFPAEFRAGMASRAERLGDTGACAPEHWEAGLRGTGEGHVLVLVQGQSAERVHEEAERHVARAPGEVVFRQDTAVLRYGREHFGFNDGFAQPSVAGSGQENRPGEGVREKDGWRLLRPGEVVLGYEDEDGLLPPAPPRPLGRNATFMVVRKLEQDVHAWRTWLRDAAAWTGADEEWLAAKVCGRWTDGTPVALEPGRRKQRTIGAKHEMNDFAFADDPRGLRCPIAAHVRRVNPRDGLSGGAHRTRRHRIIRRGMPYGPPLDGEAPDDVERGLLFACFNASIARQFEIVQDWQVRGNVFALGPRNRDFLTGSDDGSAPFTIPGAPPIRVPGPGRRLVTVRGGEYLYVPSSSGLRAICEGRA